MQTRKAQMIEDVLQPEIEEVEYFNLFSTARTFAMGKQRAFLNAVLPSTEVLHDEYHSEIIPGR